MSHSVSLIRRLRRCRHFRLSPLFRLRHLIPSISAASETTGELNKVETLSGIVLFFLSLSLVLHFIDATQTIDSGGGSNENFDALIGWAMLIGLFLARIVCRI